MKRLRLKLRKEALVDFNNSGKISKLLKRKVGRPVTKPNRVKIGLSISGEVNDMLISLAINGRTKSKVAEMALNEYAKTIKEQA